MPRSYRGFTLKQNINHFANKEMESKNDGRLFERKTANKKKIRKRYLFGFCLTYRMISTKGKSDI